MFQSPERKGVHLHLLKRHHPVAVLHRKDRIVKPSQSLDHDLLLFQVRARRAFSRPAQKTAGTAGKSRVSIPASRTQSSQAPRRDHHSMLPGRSLMKWKSQIVRLDRLFRPGLQRPRLRLFFVDCHGFLQRARESSCTILPVPIH